MPTALILSLALSSTSAFFWRRRLRGPDWVDQPREDRHQKRAVSRVGGACWLTGFFAGALLGPLTPLESLLLAASLAAFFIGLADDSDRVGPRVRLVAQSLLLVGGALLILILREPGMPSLHPGWPLVGVLVLALGTQIALQIFDNMDAALAPASAAALAALALAAPNPTLARAGWSGCGASLGFLLWNLPPARMFLGNSGSQAVALVTSTLLILVLAPAGRPATAVRFAVLFPLAWVLFDLGFVVCSRLRRHRAPWRGGSDHATHRLARLLGSDARAAAPIALVAGVGLILAWWLLRGSR